MGKTSLAEGFWLLFAGVLINRLGILAPSFLALFLTAESGVPPWLIGTLVGVWGAGSVTGSLAGGVLADRVGPRGAILFSQGVAVAACSALAAVRYPELLGVAVFLAGCASTLHKPSGAIVVTRVVPPSKHVQAFGRLYWASNIGAAISPAISGVLLERSGYWLIVLNITTALGYAAVASRLPSGERGESGKTREGGAEKEARSFRGFLAPFRSLTTALFLLLSFCLAAIYLQKQSTLPLDMEAQGINSRTYGLVISLNGLLIIAAQPLVSRFARRLGVELQFFLAALLVASGFGANGIAAEPWSYAVALVIWTTGEMLLVPQASAFLVRHAPEGRIGSYQGAYYFVWNLGLVVGAPLGVGIMETRGSSFLWAVSFALGITVAVVHGVFVMSGARRARPRGGDLGAFRT